MTQRILLNSKDNALKLIAYIHDDKAKLNELLKVWNKEDITEIAEKQRITICPVSPNETERKQIYSYLTNAPEYAKLPTTHKKHIISKYEAIPKEHIFNNDDAYDIQVRKLILNIYINEIITKAKEQSPNKTELLRELINKQGAYHKDIFTNAFKQANKNTIAGKLWDLIYTDLYNEYIYKQLDEHINKISKEIKQFETEMPKVDEHIKRLLQDKNKLTWNADKTALGTLFGTLYSEGIITGGTKTDLIKILQAIFKDVSPATLKTNVYLSKNQNEQKLYYHNETNRIIKELAQKIRKSNK